MSLHVYVDSIHIYTNKDRGIPTIGKQAFNPYERLTSSAVHGGSPNKVQLDTLVHDHFEPAHSNGYRNGDRWGPKNAELNRLKVSNHTKSLAFNTTRK